MGNKEVPLPGEARQEGPSLRDELLADPTPPPQALLEESYEFLGDNPETSSYTTLAIYPR